jgi:hypothetical protein
MDALAPILLAWLVGIPLLVVGAAWLGAMRRRGSAGAPLLLRDLTAQPRCASRRRAALARVADRRPCDAAGALTARDG